MHWVFIAAHGLSLVAVSGLLIAVASLIVEHGLQNIEASVAEHRLNSCDGLVLVRSSWTRDRTHVSCIDRRILYH